MPKLIIVSWDVAIDGIVGAAKIQVDDQYFTIQVDGPQIFQVRTY
jgi:hypothetical protein